MGIALRATCLALGARMCSHKCMTVVSRRGAVSGAEDTDEVGGRVIPRPGIQDGVLRGEADQSFVAAQGCGEAEEDLIVAGMSFIARAESAVAGQSRDRPLDSRTRGSARPASTG
ncbi:hypothetical protein GCM10017771_93960 [Streptomyces capitiformicae]|uniref:Uncharacterized protein n=1 Tax=Streptomyces capitiformicae TaxID=2014920 RepID=A0A919DRL7_9ACTN|nr:hypothetical protein GCM10017771_93960 [Streptomyces capitiformicae]